MNGPVPATGIRIPPDVKARIQQRAEAMGMNLSQYMIRASLGELNSVDERLAMLERRVTSLERGKGPDVPGPPPAE